MKSRVYTRIPQPVCCRTGDSEVYVDWRSTIIPVPVDLDPSVAVRSVKVVDNTASVRWINSLGKTYVTARTAHEAGMSVPGDRILIQAKDGWSLATVISNPTPMMFRQSKTGVVEAAPAARKRSAYIDLAGKTFGRWTVLRYAAGMKEQSWWCRCACGGPEIMVSTAHLRKGESTQCRACADKARKGVRPGTPRSTKRSVRYTCDYCGSYNYEYGADADRRLECTCETCSAVHLVSVDYDDNAVIHSSRPPSIGDLTTHIARLGGEIRALSERVRQLEEQS